MKPLLLHAMPVLLSLSATTQAQEGGELGRMWTFDNPPLAYLEQEYGFKPDQAWLDSLRLGSLRLGGESSVSGFGSASFVSPKGLILTSTRCVRDAVTATRPNDLDIINAGFVAAAREDELRMRTRKHGWLTAAQLIKTSNVTDEVNEGVAPTDNEVRTRQKREANKKSILDAARRADPKLAPQIVSLHQGAVFRLYQYRVYDDLRLVALPHVQAARFGGNKDNFTYPRYCVDFAFLRAYEDGKPADTREHHFRCRSSGAKKGELVFVSGNPGTTKRLLTKAQIELERDVRIPIEAERLENGLRIWKDPAGRTFSGAFDPEKPSKYYSWVRTSILALQDALKAARGNLHGLENAKLMARKGATEKAFRTRVMANELLAKKYGDLWNRIANVVARRRRHEPRKQFHRASGLVLAAAVDIVRLCDPQETEPHRELAKKKLQAWSGTTISPNFYATARALDHFARAQGWLPDDGPFLTKVLGGRSPKEFLNLMMPLESGRSSSWLGYPQRRDALVKAGWKTIQASEDPTIVAARELVTLMRENDKLGEELDAKEEALRAELGRALLACYGTSVGSDGTMTLRFTDGVIRGLAYDGTIAPHRTTFGGLYARNVEFDNRYPFNLPQIWLDRRAKIDMTTPINFASTNDISVGNAGSVVVNKDLEVVGVVVDGNRESLHNDFVFKGDVPRAISVHVGGILETLVKIYDAHRVAEELAGR